tara:strand:- start:5331 stop:5489 length:159 start_codon:yes stop_codon:yes gene_type:complete
MPIFALYQIHRKKSSKSGNISNFFRAIFVDPVTKFFDAKQSAADENFRIAIL